MTHCDSSFSVVAGIIIDLSKKFHRIDYDEKAPILVISSLSTAQILTIIFLFSDEANQTRQQRQVSGNNGEQAAADHGGMFGSSSQAEVVVRELRSIKAVISRFIASSVEKSRPKVRSCRFLGACSTLFRR